MKQHDSSYEDLRQRRTRKHLTEALFTLLEERPFSRISVVDICQRAMVHRTTFYAHFDDKQALLRYAIGELERSFEPVDPSLDPRTGPKEYFMALFHNAFEFLKAHKAMLLAGEHDTQFDVLYEIITEALRTKLTGTIDLDPEITARFYAGGLLSLLRWWVTNGTMISDEVLIQHVERFIPQSPSSLQKG
ncbi:TetR/AcrR family transcriptional regulator [Flavonifractor hominis]|uniref:TetR/AcrR family transcriptional regulator n=1 Tax=Flavonifractor hominis TaxID=3133178 RepID=A0ABV1ENV2_9FIRM